MASLQELLPRYTTNASRFLVIDNMLVHYRDEGKGMPILLLHGAFSSLHTFNAWATALKKHYRVVRLDLMAFGLTGPNPNEEYTVPAYLRLIRRFLMMLDINFCHVVGNSLGGWLAWEYAYRYPQQVQKLVLVDAAGLMEKSNIPLPFRLAQSRLASHVLRYVVRRSIVEQFVKQVYYDVSKVTDKVVDRYFDMYARDGNNTAFIAMVNTPFDDHRNHLRSIEQPTLILWGEEDEWIPVSDAYIFHKLLPNSELKVYPKVGHVPMEEIPDQSVEDLLKFLRSRTLPTPNRSLEGL